jgi:hypothetical protein
MNIGALAANVIDLGDRKIKPVAVKQAQDQPRPAPRKKNYIIAPFRVLEDDRINKSAALPVLMAICSFTNRAGETWVGQATIAKIFKVSQQSISKHIATLVSLGYLEIVQKAGKEYSARMRVVFDPDMTLTDVKATIPERLKPVIPPEVILSKEAARERFKKMKEAIKVQPQKLCQEPQDNVTNIQPQKLCDNDSWHNQTGVLAQPPEVVTPTTSRGCENEGFKDIEGLLLRVWKKKNEEYGFVRSDARDARASEVIQGWAIPVYQMGSLLATMLDELHSRHVDPPATLEWFANLGEDLVREMCAGLPDGTAPC